MLMPLLALEDQRSDAFSCFLTCKYTRTMFTVTIKMEVHLGMRSKIH